MSETEDIKSAIWGQVDRFGRSTLAETWHRLHLNAVAWSEIWQSDDLIYDRLLLDEGFSSFIESLSTCPTSRWSALCEACGWTVYGAVALSWCKDANIAEVWAGWEASGFPVKPSPGFERPARFLNPALLPDVATGAAQSSKTSVAPRSLRALTEAAQNRPVPLCALIAVNDLPVLFDLPTDMMAGAAPDIAATLRARMERQIEADEKNLPDAATCDHLLSAWGHTVTDTPYDIWTLDEEDQATDQDADISDAPASDQLASELDKLPSTRH